MNWHGARRYAISRGRPDLLSSPCVETLDSRCRGICGEPEAIPLPKQDRGQASTACPTEQGMGQRIFPSHPKLPGKDIIGTDKHGIPPRTSTRSRTPSLHDSRIEYVTPSEWRHQVKCSARIVRALLSEESRQSVLAQVIIGVVGACIVCSFVDGCVALPRLTRAKMYARISRERSLYRELPVGPGFQFRRQT